ncbi:MAG: ATP-binding protein [Atopobiaceae bacterium]|nr:ATP-binding protein [Atopobiaceae bacterium]
MTSESTETQVGRFVKPTFTEEEIAQMHLAAQAWKAEREAADNRHRAFMARIPKRYEGAVLEGAPHGDALAKWVFAPTDGVILTGGIGTGKTWLASATLKAFMAKWTCSGRFITAADYIDECREGNKEAYYSPRVLVLDDLGKERASEYVTSCLFQLLDKRVSTHRKTIITTNYTHRELLERLVVDGDTTTAQAFASRLKRFTVVKVEGADRR